jgi:hypothetical protein
LRSLSLIGNHFSRAALWRHAAADSLAFPFS